MQSFGTLMRSTILTKWVMAVTGFLVVGFLLAHLSGNFLIFVGPDAMNEYGVFLREILHGTAIWILRGGLLVAFVLHIWSAIRLARLNRTARPHGYARVTPRSSSLASRTMLLSGLLILAFAIYHLLHFTLGGVHTDYYHFTDAMGRHDVYRMVILSFQQPVISIAYVLAMIFTGMHLNHAISSAVQTLGINHKRYTPLIRKAGIGLSIVVAGAFSAVPLAILFGIVK